MRYAPTVFRLISNNETNKPSSEISPTASIHNRTGVGAYRIRPSRRRIRSHSTKLVSIQRQITSFSRKSKPRNPRKHIWNWSYRIPSQPNRCRGVSHTPSMAANMHSINNERQHPAAIYALFAKMKGVCDTPLQFFDWFQTIKPTKTHLKLGLPHTLTTEQV